ncbi:MAG: non-canonical purine NTP pyrophosphatase [Alphaproteobacteria bacterium]|nr:non-canonical purine NTP pyrophosphatase [Alphaproteobacteria bacterium]
MKKITEKQIVIASHNKGKSDEIAYLLASYPIEVLSAADMNIPDPEETEDTFVGNALLKARHCAQRTGLLSLADDSGLVVPAIGGQPGIYSARWAGLDRDMGKAIARLEKELHGVDDASAYFTCALALAWPEHDGEIQTQTFTGHWDGHIAFPERGQGFGYTPVFVPKGFAITAAEMPPEQRYALSGRAKAFKQLVESCF